MVRERAKRSSRIKVVKKKLNNKTRKGNYFYLKEKGKRGRYYKVNEKIGLPEYIYAYDKNLLIKRGGVTKKRVQKERKLDKLSKKYPKIESTLGAGYAGNTINNPQKLTPFGIRTAYMDLLRNKDKVRDGMGIVRDKELLQLITRPENVDKWKHRVMYEIMGMNQNGEVMFTINPSNVKGLHDIKREVINKIQIGQDYESQYKRISAISKSGYRINAGITKRGKIADLKIKMIFRKER